MILYIVAATVATGGCNSASNKPTEQAMTKPETEPPAKKKTPDPAAPPMETTPSKTPSRISTAEQVTQADAGTTPWISPEQLPFETWESQYLNAGRIGVVHQSVAPSQTRGSKLLNISGKTVLEVLRDGRKTRQTSTFESLESPTGEVERYSERVETNGRIVETAGNVVGGMLQLTVTQNNQKSSLAIPFDSKTWGPLGVYQILRREPMKSGEQREAKVFIPYMLKVAAVQLIAGTVEDTPLAEGKSARLLPVEVRMTVDKSLMRWQLWADEQGNIQKTVVLSGVNLSTYRISAEEAQSLSAASDVELFAATAIKLNAALPTARTATRIVYAVEAEGFDPFTTISAEASQTTKSLTARMAEVTVHRFGPDNGPPPGPSQTPPQSDALAPSPLINSDNPLITKLAEELVGTEKDPAAAAMALCRGVHAKIQTKNLLHLFDSAAEVAEHLEGDCTEHSVLLAALLRNRGIPARISAGVVYVENETGPAMAYHMWTEAWIGQSWLPLDATQGDVADAARIKFLDSVLPDPNPYGAMLPVMENLGRLKVSVLRAE